MPEKAPKLNEMLPIDNNDHTLEVDTRWLLTESPEVKALDTSTSDLEEASDDCEDSGEYDDPRLGAALTATQVLELLNVGKR